MGVADARPEPSQPQTAGTLSEDAYRLIKWRITTVQLAPGAPFTEAELAETLKLSRTPLREALLLLRTEGLITVEGRSGYRVSPVTLRDVRDLTLVRRLLEGEAAYQAARNLFEVGGLESLEERNPGSLDGSDFGSVSRWIEMDTRFHHALAVASGNRQLQLALEPVLDRSARHLHLVLALESAPRSVAHGHDELLGALRARDQELAKALITDQICSIEETVTRAVTSSHSLLSVNVQVEKPQNRFYLDLTAADLDSADGGAMIAPPAQRQRTTRPLSGRMQT
jgi:DNA-binding GntR family transcriptional regulator